MQQQIHAPHERVEVVADQVALKKSDFAFPRGGHLRIGIVGETLDSMQEIK